MDITTALRCVIDFLTVQTPVEDLPYADSLFVFGSSSHEIPLHAAKLFQQKGFLRIIITGGYNRNNALPHGYRIEAKYFKQVMWDHGVPDYRFILEQEASNTLENVTFGMRTVYESGFRPQSIIAVCIPAHQRRVLATFARHYPDLKVVCNGPAHALEFYQKPRHLKKVCKEVTNLTVYAQKGDIAPVDIPEDVREAHQFLLKNTAP